MAQKDDEEHAFNLYHHSGNLDEEPIEEPEDGEGRDPYGHNSGDDDLKDLNFNDLLVEGRRLLLHELVKNVKRGIASPQEMSTLRQMLKDNGMVMGDPNSGAGEGGNDEADEKADLPHYGDPEYANDT